MSHNLSQEKQVRNLQQNPLEC